MTVGLPFDKLLSRTARNQFQTEFIATNKLKIKWKKLLTFSVMFGLNSIDHREDYRFCA